MNIAHSARVPIFVAMLLLFSQFVQAEQTTATVVTYETGSRRASLDTARDLRDSKHIAIYGVITKEAVKELASALRSAAKNPIGWNQSGDPVLFVFLDSPGGDVASAIAMGRMLRAVGADVWIAKNSECSSACVLIFAGGVTRMAVAPFRLGLHRPHFDPTEFSGLSHQAAQTAYNALGTAVRQYLREMGISDRTYEMMLRVSSTDISYIDAETAEELGLIGEDPAYQEWQRARESGKPGQEFLKRLERHANCQESGRPVKECIDLLRGKRTKGANLPK